MEYISMENAVIADIYSAKDTILRDIIKKIEGREAVLDDAKNIVLCPHPYRDGQHRESVIYRGVNLGYIEVNMAEKCVKFILKEYAEQEKVE